MAQNPMGFTGVMRKNPSYMSYNSNFVSICLETPGRHLWLMTIDLSYLTLVDQEDFMEIFQWKFSRKSMVGGWRGG